MERNGETDVWDYSTNVNVSVPQAQQSECGTNTSKIMIANDVSRLNENGLDIQNYDISMLANDTNSKLSLLTVHPADATCVQNAEGDVTSCSSLLNGCDNDRLNGLYQKSILAHLVSDKKCSQKLHDLNAESVGNNCSKNDGSFSPQDDSSAISNEKIPDENVSSLSSISQISNSSSAMTDSDECSSSCSPSHYFQNSELDHTESETCKCNSKEKISKLENSEVCQSDNHELTISVSESSSNIENTGVEYVGYESELQMPDIMRLIETDLSEPYSIYTYRYFIHNWPELCFLAMIGTKCAGAIVCKLDHHHNVKRGYIAMLAVDENYRRRKIGSNLALKAIQAMVAGEAEEIVLETEITNKSALKLYENLGFVRAKRLFRYYLNGVDALRLKLWIR